MKEIQGCIDIGENVDDTQGFLVEVPILREVPAHVQIDLLAETWNRQRHTQLIEANLLDAAVVYAACRTAAWIISDDPEAALLYLQGGPRKLNTPLTPETAEHLDVLFDRFWDDIDFLTLSDCEDMDRGHADAFKKFMRFSDDVPIYEALSRGRVSQNLATNLTGLLTMVEIEECVRMMGRIR